MPPPSTTSPTLGPTIRKERRLRTTSVNPPILLEMPTPEPAMLQVPGSELAALFKDDLTNIRSLVTCSICDQLLYEPWTLGCGHTYCYSCLCSWFVPHRNRKTCPECRAKVKQLPAPNFLVKQTVEIFIKRIELMPADESVAQHTAKRVEEIAEVEKDKNSVTGLFKGTFPERGGQLMLDEADGVYRCPHCHHEHEGGPSCANCGLAIDDGAGSDGGFSDVDFDDLEADLELDLEDDIRVALGFDDDAYIAQRAQRAFRNHQRMRNLGRSFPGQPSDLSTSEDSEADTEADSEADEDEGSLNEFVVRDEEESPPVRRVGARNRQVITILSDDESDEGAILNRRLHRPHRSNVSAGLSSPSVLTVTDSSTNGSEGGDTPSEADRLRTAGWSPLDHGTDSDTEDTPNEQHNRYQRQSRLGFDEYGYAIELEDSDDDSDNTETMIGNGVASDDEDDHGRDESETPAYHPDFHQYGNDVYEHLGDDTDDDEYPSTPNAATDRDGDTDMSVSPEARRSTNPYRNDTESSSSRQQSVSTSHDNDGESTPRGGREESVSTNGDLYYNQAENLGFTHQIHDIPDDSSEASIVPPRRRRRPRDNARIQHYDPRISLVFADHLQNVQGSRDQREELEELDEWSQANSRRVIEPASHNRRIAPYTTFSTRSRVDAAQRISGSPAVQTIASTNRATRRSPHYRRYNRTWA